MFMHTLAGSPGHLKLVHEAAELLSYSHGALQTFVIEEVLLAPLGALLVLQERGMGLNPRIYRTPPAVS